MKTQPIQPAEIAVDEHGGEPPRSLQFADLYHPRVGAWAQAGHVFLRGNGLPGRWAGRSAFTILETGFGLGNNFLATWAAWQRDPARCAHLLYVAIERHPLRHVDLARAHARSPEPALAAALLQAWPALTPNLHLLGFDGGRVRLLLALGDIAALLPSLRLRADAFYLDGFAPAANPAMWQPRVLAALGRKAAPGATLATWSVASEVRKGLRTAGFEVDRGAGIGGKREITLARYAPRFVQRSACPEPFAARTNASNIASTESSRPVDRAEPAAPRRPAAGPAVGFAVGLGPPQRALVVGAGLAGAAVARALARRGWTVDVFERRERPAAEASGNLAGLFHGSVHPGDGPHARLLRTAALHAQREYSVDIAAGVEGRVDGLLRVDTGPGGLAAMQAMLDRQALPSAYVQALDAAQASQRAGAELGGPAWFYPGGGWISPAAWVRHALATPGVTLHTGVDVTRATRQDGGWTIDGAVDRAAGGSTALVAAGAGAAILVLANAAGAAPLLAPLGHAAWPLRHERGQVTHWDLPDVERDRPRLPDAENRTLRLPVAGDGYALPRSGGGILCGATRDAVEPSGGPADGALREADQEHNVLRLKRLTGLDAPADRRQWQGRVGWRLQSDDRLPVCGEMAQAYQRGQQARWLPRETGLFVITALGSRGITFAPLLGEFIAAQASGSPWPLEQDLADAIDPARWIVRGSRRAQGKAG